MNAARKPGEWQTYDIVFEAPRFEDGKVVPPGYVTVLLERRRRAQPTQILWANQPTDHAATYAPRRRKLPLDAQNHGNPVRFRNIWIRRLTKDRRSR